VTLLLRLAEPRAEYATGYDGIEGAARKTFNWGTKKRAGGKVQSIAGAIKEGVGTLTGDDQLADEGAAEQIVGDVKDAAGQLGHAAGQTIHDMNQ
jgi:uncharacterized protein YjbJ (UPF0337 family)